MRKREPFLLTFSFFLIIALSLLGLSRIKILETLSAPFAEIGKFSGILTTPFRNEEKQALIAENQMLKKKLVDQQKLQKEAAALRDQFESTKTKSLRLLPAQVVGVFAFVPGVTTAEFITLDKGVNDGIEKGQAVIIEDHLIGIVSVVGKALSRVQLIAGPKTIITAKVLSQEGNGGNEVLGVVKGLGWEELVLENVLPSETVKVKDIVVTKGDLDVHGKGIPADLIIGTIASVEKKPSALFQTAKVIRRQNISIASHVFIVLGIE